MIKIYGLATCPHCDDVKEQIQGRENEYEYIDIGTHVRYLKEFMRLRDTNPIYDACKENGTIGIPTFVLEDGTLTLSPDEAGLQKSMASGKVCSLEDHKNGVEGC